MLAVLISEVEELEKKNSNKKAGKTNTVFGKSMTLTCQIRYVKSGERLNPFSQEAITWILQRKIDNFASCLVGDAAGNKTEEP